MSPIPGLIGYLERKDAVSRDTQAQRGARFHRCPGNGSTLLLTTVFLLPVLKINMCRLIWNNLPYFLVTVMKGVVRSAPCAAVRLAAQSRQDETLRSIRRAERLVLQSNAQSLDSAARYRASPFSSRLPDLTILGHSVNEKQRDDEIKTRPKSTGTMVRLRVHMQYSLHALPLSFPDMQ